MIIKGVNNPPNKNVKDSVKTLDEPQQFIEAEAGYTDDNEKTKHCNKKQRRILIAWILCSLSGTFLRILLAMAVIIPVILFTNRIKYAISNVEEVKIFIEEDEYISGNQVKYDLIDVSHESVKGSKYEYDIEDIVLMDITVSRTKLQDQCLKLPTVLRFDCHPDNGVTEVSCIQRGCCWNPVLDVSLERMPLNVPYCYYPNNWNIYEYENYTGDNDNFSGYLKLKGQSYYQNDLPLIKMDTMSIDDSTIRVKIYDPLQERYEPPWPVRTEFQSSNFKVPKPQYRLSTDDKNPGFKIDRVIDSTTIFNSIGIGGFIFAEQFLQISSLLPSSNIYGLGEHRSKLKLNTDWQIFTMFNRDQPPTANANLYGSHPFYLVIEESGNCHGVLFLNSNAMDIILQPTPAITFRTIGGIFDIYFFLGPTPQDVMRQYSEIVGKPFLPPYWSLGFHLCRFGYGTLNNTKNVWNRTVAAGIPFDTQWNDLDYMDKNNDFTYNKETFGDLPQFVKELHDLGMHYIPLIDAGVSASETNGTYLPFDEGMKEGIFVKDETSDKPFIGKVWNMVSTTWPDFTNPKAKDYYLNMMKDMHDNFAYDGAWIDMNEPSNFYDGHINGCSQNNLNYPKYMPRVLGNLLYTKTFCMNAKQYLGVHYDLHNTFGTSQAVVVNYALASIRKKRPFIISRSTWVGHGAYAGHWSGDVFSTWYDLKMSIPEVLTFNFFQIPMVGADICGFNGNTTKALCNRWMQLGAFYPFSRNHNTDDAIDQDPVAMGDLVVRSSKRALTIRYWLLPYLYTLFFRAHKFGETVARPLFFEFFNDPATYNIDTQFLWGSSLMINPVLDEGHENVTAYIPHGVWYDLYTKKSFFSIGKTFVLDAPLDTIPLLIRGGSILPAQKPGATTTESRKNRFELLVALDQFENAKGELYWDDGDSLNSIENGEYMWLLFKAQNQTLSSSIATQSEFKEEMILGRIQVLGISKGVSQVSLNGNAVTFKYDSGRSCLSVNGMLVDLKKPFSLSWKYEEDEEDDSQLKYEIRD